MRNISRLSDWDAAVASYLANRRTFGRRYSMEEWMLGLLRRFLVARGATDLDQHVFDQWRKTFLHLRANTRRGREMTIYKFCRYPLPVASACRPARDRIALHGRAASGRTRSITDGRCRPAIRASTYPRVEVPPQSLGTPIAQCPRRTSAVPGAPAQNTQRNLPDSTTTLQRQAQLQLLFWRRFGADHPESDSGSEHTRQRRPASLHP